MFLKIRRTILTVIAVAFAAVLIAFAAVSIAPSAICADAAAADTATVQAQAEPCPEGAHIWNDGAVTAPATCTATGIKTFTCTVCGSTKTSHIPATGHTEVHEAAVAPTCTTVGRTEGVHCSVCNTVITPRELIPATGHTEVTDPAVTPTCTTIGKTEGSHCSVCNTVINAPEELGYADHTWGEWTQIKAPTEDEFGEERRICTLDSTHYQLRQIPKLVPGGSSNPTPSTKTDAQTADVWLILDIVIGVIIACEIGYVVIKLIRKKRNSEV